MPAGLSPRLQLAYLLAQDWRCAQAAAVQLLELFDDPISNAGLSERQRDATFEGACALLRQCGSLLPLAVLNGGLLYLVRG